MATSRNVDFSSVKDGGNFNKRRIPAGDYLATVTKVEDAQAKDDTFQYLFTIKIDSKATSVFPYYCKLQENQLWKLRNLMIAAGLTVPKKKVKVDPNRVVGRKIGVTVEDDEYEGKEQSTIAAVFPAAELSDGGTFVASDDDDDDEVIEDEELEEEAEEAEEVEDEEEEEEDPLADLDRAALKAELKKLDANFKAKVSQTDEDLRDMLRAAQAKAARAKAAAAPKAAPKAAAKAPVKRAARPAPVDDEEADDDDDLDIGEAPPAPVSTSRRGRKPKVDITTVTDDELDELDIDDM